MKMIMIVYNHSIDDELLEMLKENKVSGYTHITNATGEGKDDPHKGTNVWPSTNNVVFTAIEKEAKVKKVISGVKSLAKRFPGEGVRAFAYTLTDIV